MIEIAVARTVPAIVTVALVSGGLLTWHWFDDSALERALAADLKAGRSSAPRLLKEVGAVPDQLRESSGLAISRSQPGILWSHNDSGDGPNLYAIDISGKLLAVFRVT